MAEGSDDIIEKEVLFVSKDDPAEKYRLLKILGHGFFGWVSEAERVRDGIKVALKCPQPCAEPDFQHEIDICRDISASGCEHVNRCLDVAECLHPSFKYTGMVLELCHFDLEKFWSSTGYGEMTSYTFAVIMEQIWSGVAHVHSKSYVHGDLHLKNILVNALTGTMKIADFGMADKIRDNEELKMKNEVTKLARALSDFATCAVSGPELEDPTRCRRCALSLENDLYCRQYPAHEVQEVLKYVFQITHDYTYFRKMSENRRWWEAYVAQAPHRQKIATIATEWMHGNPESGGVTLPIAIGTTFVRSFGFQGYDAIDAAGIASDLGHITTAEIKDECTAFFQNFLRQQLALQSPT